MTNEKSPHELFNVARRAINRYLRIAIGPVAVVIGLTIILVLRLPNYYTSDALIFIQPQRISSKVVDTPDKQEMQERLEALVQEILSRPRLRSVLERFRIYPQLRGPSGLEKAVTKFRKDIDISPVTSPSSGVNLLQTFKLSYNHRDPKVAYEITKALSNLFIEESLVDRRSEVQGTEEFIEGQLTEARKKLEETEDKVQKFITDNSGRLPEHLEASIARLENLQAQVATNLQLISANTVRRTNLQHELDEMSRQRSVVVTDPTSRESADPVESLAKLQSALVVLQSRYSEKHPDVINTRKRIEALKSQLGSKGKKGSTRSYIPSGNIDAIRNLRRELGEIDITIKSLTEENSRLKPAIDELQGNIQYMPVREQELLKIKRDYANVKDNYERLLAAKQEASIQASLIRSQKGTQFRIVEPAELPAIPTGPNRPLIILGAALASVVLFIGIPLFLYNLSPAFKDMHEIENHIGLPVLGIIPPMPTEEHIALHRRAAVVTMLTSFVSLFGGGLLIYWIV